MSDSQNGEVLVYIPCHTDFLNGLSQVKRLRTDFEAYSSKLDAQFRKLYVILSVNSFVPKVSDVKLANELCDEVILYGDSLLADVNISQGYLIALQRRPDIFWNLSANDMLTEGSIGRILHELESNKNIDLVITCPNQNSQLRQLTDTRVVNGVISGVIYRTKRLIQSFNVAPFFPWTGWSQLTVVHAALQNHHSLNALFIDQSKIFLQNERSLSINGSSYAHSFSGGLIQRFLFSKNDKERRTSLRNFVWSNFHRIHLYSARDKNQDDRSNLVDSKHYLSWNSLISEALIKSYTPFAFLLYRILRRVPFEKLVAYEFSKRIKTRMGL
jgi:hypothetical protein